MALQLYKIATVEVGSAGAATIDFTSIPQGYTDLMIKVSTRGTTANASGGYYYDITFNNTSSNRSGRYVEGANGTTVFSATYTPWGLSTPSDFTANTFSNNEIYIPNYAGSNYKSLSSDAVNENNASAGRIDLIAGLWSDTAAITSIKFVQGAGNFAQYSTATLYGIL